MPRGASSIRLSELASALECERVGESDPLLTGVAPLDAAGASDLAFVRSHAYAAGMAESGAAAVIVPRGVAPGGRPALLSDNPALDFARAVEHILPAQLPEPGVDPSAVVAASARVDPSASVGANAVVGEHCSVGAGTVLDANVTLYPDVSVGEECRLHSGVVVRESCELGDRVQLQPGVVVGGDGFGYVGEGGRLRKVPQVGRVVIEDDVEIGANTTVDRATLFETRIRRGAKIDNLVQVGHNCDIGESSVIIAQTGLSGSTVIGHGAMVMAQAGSAGHLRVGDYAFVGARAGLHKDVADGARVFGSPQLEERQWHRAMAALARLPGALKRLRVLERALRNQRDSE
jgi:UDP-3-O-[3-hydroxymyristoyl] glucosamine N-acyltransferase